MIEGCQLNEAQYLFHYAPTADAPYQAIIVGWDRPLRTYFAQVYRDVLIDDEAFCPIEFGGLLFEYPSIDVLEKAIAERFGWAFTFPEHAKAFMEAGRETRPPEALGSRNMDAVLLRLQVKLGGAAHED